MSLHSSLHYKPFLQKTILDWLKEEKENIDDVSQIIIQTVLESLLEAERNEFLKDKDPGNKRNGYYCRLAKLMSGVFSLRVPRDRLGLFKPLILEIVKQDQKNLDKLAFNLYSKGMSNRDINGVLRDIYNMETSPQYISNITSSFLDIRKKWQEKALQKEYYAIYIDALHLNIRRDTVENEAIYVVMGLKTDFTREILGIYSIPSESAAGWKTVLEDLRKRGVKDVLLFVADGLTGLENVIHDVFPSSLFQKCIVHLKRNIIKRVRVKDKGDISVDLKEVFRVDDHRDSKKEGLKRLDDFLLKWSKRYPSLRGVFNEGIKDYYFTYLDFPHDIRRMIYSTNWIERLNKEIRKVTKNKNSFPGEDSALTLIWSKLMEMEERVYKYPVTAFYSAEKELSEMLK